MACSKSGSITRGGSSDDPPRAIYNFEGLCSFKHDCLSSFKKFAYQNHPLIAVVIHCIFHVLHLVYVWYNCDPETRCGIESRKF